MVKQAKKLSAFDRAWRDLPECISTDPLAMRTLEDLRYACLIQLDLIREGQDSAEGDDPRPIQRWLKKHGVHKAK